jgi:hypothetical protein
MLFVLSAFVQLLGAIYFLNLEFYVVFLLLFFAWKPHNFLMFALCNAYVYEGINEIELKHYEVFRILPLK